MTREEFRRMLTAAISGDQDALEQLLALYAPMIDRQSTVDGRLDEDLRQYILIHIARTISKFVP